MQPSKGGMEMPAKKAKAKSTCKTTAKKKTVAKGKKKAAKKK